MESEVSSVQPEQLLDGAEQRADLGHKNGQHDDQPGQRRHHRLFLPAGTDQHLIEHGDDDADGGDPEDQIYVHFLVIPFH